MAAMTIRNIPEETHRALQQRARLHGNSAEAEVRLILQEALLPEGRVKLGTELAAIGKRYGWADLDITRDPAPAEGADFGPDPE